MSKGSKRRPTNYNKFSESYDKIFGVSKMVQAEEVEDAATSSTKQGTVLPMPASQRREGKG